MAWGGGGVTDIAYSSLIDVIWWFWTSGSKLVCVLAQDMKSD